MERSFFGERGTAALASGQLPNDDQHDGLRAAPQAPRSARDSGTRQDGGLLL